MITRRCRSPLSLSENPEKRGGVACDGIKDMKVLTTLESHKSSGFSIWLAAEANWEELV